MGNFVNKASLEENLVYKEPLEVDATLEVCRHLMQLLRSQDANIQTSALASLKEITANPSLNWVLIRGQDKISSPAATILCPAIIRLLQDSRTIPAINISLGLDILLNLLDNVGNESVKVVYETTGLVKVLDWIEDCVQVDFASGIFIQVRLLKLFSNMTDNLFIPEASEEGDEMEWTFNRNVLKTGAHGCSHYAVSQLPYEQGCRRVSKFKSQSALTEANVGKWVKIMTMLEGFVFYGILASADTKLGKFTIKESVQVIKRPIGRNWDFKNRKSLQIFFFDDCRTVEIVSKDTVDKLLAPWNDDDEDEETKKDHDNLLTPWTKKTNEEENK